MLFPPSEASRRQLRFAALPSATPLRAVPLTSLASMGEASAPAYDAIWLASAGAVSSGGGGPSGAVVRIDVSAVQQFVDRAAREIMNDIRTLHEIRADDSHVVEHDEISAYWSRVLGGADELAEQVADELDAAFQSAWSARTEHGSGNSLAQTSSALSDLKRAVSHLDAARNLLVDERDAAVAGADRAIAACKATIEVLIMTAGLTVGATADTNAGRVLADAVTRFLLGTGADAATQYSTSQLDALASLAAGLAAAAEVAADAVADRIPVPGARGLPPAVRETIAEAIRGAIGQLLEELATDATELLPAPYAPEGDGDLPADASTRRELVAQTGQLASGAVASAIANRLENAGVLPKGTAKQLSYLPGSRVPRNHKLNQAIFKIAEKAAELAIPGIVSALAGNDAPNREPSRRAAAVDAMVKRFAGLGQALANFETEMRQARGQAAAARLADAAEALRHPPPQYDRVPLQALEEIRALSSGWIAHATQIVRAADRCGADVKIRAPLDLHELDRVLGESERIMRESTLNGGKSVAAVDGAREWTVPKSRAAATLERLRQLQAKIPCPNMVR